MLAGQWLTRWLLEVTSDVLNLTLAGTEFGWFGRACTIAGRARWGLPKVGERNRWGWALAADVDRSDSAAEMDSPPPGGTQRVMPMARYLETSRAPFRFAV